MSNVLDNAHTAPKFAAPDPGALAVWYRDYLGFPQLSIYEDGDYAIVRRGHLTLHFWKCLDRQIAENTACYTELTSVDHLNALHAEWLNSADREGFALGRVESSPQDKLGHGMREFHVWDPAGNLIALGAALR